MHEKLLISTIGMHVSIALARQRETKVIDAVYSIARNHSKRQRGTCNKYLGRRLLYIMLDIS